MILSTTQTGRVYKFKYSGCHRLALVIEQHADMITCWDFTCEGYRNFKFKYIQNMQDLTGKVLITDNLNANLPVGARSKEFQGKLYAVRIK